MEVLGPKTSHTRPSKTKIRRGPGGEAIWLNCGGQFFDLLEDSHLHLHASSQLMVCCPEALLYKILTAEHEQSLPGPSRLQGFSASSESTGGDG